MARASIRTVCTLSVSVTIMSQVPIITGVLVITFLRLQKVIKSAKKKIKEQAAVISEQCISILRQDKFPQDLVISPDHGAACPPITASTSTTTTSLALPRPLTNHTCMMLFDSPYTECSDVYCETKLSNQPIPDATTCKQQLTTGTHGNLASDKSDIIQNVMNEDSGLTMAVIDKESESSSKNRKLSVAAGSDVTSSGSVGICSPMNTPSPTLLAPPTCREGPRHVLYSHTHHNGNTRTVHEAPKVVQLLDTSIGGNKKTSSSSTSAGQALSLKGGENSAANKVRYKTVIKSPPTLPPAATKLDESPSSNSPSIDDSTPPSPSLLTFETPLKMRPSPVDSAAVGPMSCSMFETIPLSPPVVVNAAAIQTPKKGVLVNQIASRLVTTREKAAALDSPGPLQGQGMLDVVPITPGVKSVESIHVNDRWMSSGHHHAASPQRNSHKETSGQPAGEGKQDKPKEAKADNSGSSAVGVKGDNMVSRTRRLAAGDNGAVKHQYKKRGYNMQSVGKGKRKRPHDDPSGGSAHKRMHVTTSTGSNEEEEEGEEDEEVVIVSATKQCVTANSINRYVQCHANGR